VGVYKRGKVFYVRYWLPQPDGTRKEKSEAVSPSKALAKQVLAKRTMQIREGKFFACEEARDWPYSRLLNRYLEYSRTAKKSLMA
jgi:hypothetical protein